MFIGNILIGSLNFAQQVELIQHKKLKKLQIFCKRERLDVRAETRLLDSPEGMETFLADYLHSYSIRKDIQQKLQEKKLLQLIKVYCDSHDDFCFSEASVYCSFLKTYGAPKHFDVTKDAEKGLFESENEQLLLQMAAENRIFARENKIRFLRLALRYPTEVEQYLSQYGKDVYLDENEQLELTQENIGFCFIWKNVYLKTEGLLFEPENKDVLLEYAQQRRFSHHENEVKFVLLRRQYPTEVKQYLCQYGRDVDLTEDEQLEITRENVRFIFIWKNVFLKTEGLLFEPENKDVLLEYAQQRRFAHHENEVKFLLLSKQYPKEVEQYLSQYGKDIPLTEDEQLEITKENIRFIFIWGNVYLKTESLLFEPENEDVLLEYVQQRRFAHHENEVKCLLLSKQYPTEVEKYLSQYGKDITLNEDEELKVMACSQTSLVYIKVQNPVVYREYILSEKRKKYLPFSEEDLPMLIRLSVDNPTLLNEFVEKCGKLSPKYEAELFFKADAGCREKYISLYGVDLKNLVQVAADYGATEQELDLLRQANLGIISHIFNQLETWKIFDVTTIKSSAKCTFGKQVSGGVCLKTWQCEQCELLQKALPTALSVLLNIARRNYLLGAC